MRTNALRRAYLIVPVYKKEGFNTYSDNEFLSAVADVYGDSNAPYFRGRVWFSDTPEGVRVDAQVTGLPKNETGFYGFHIHEKGNCFGDFEGAGGHYNPTDTRHPLHAGDFPMLIATRTMQAWMSFVTTRFTVRDIIGRAVIVHGGRDDYTSQPAGDAGDRIGCGVIRAI